MKFLLVTLLLLAACGPSESEIAACKVARSKVDAETAPAVTSVQERLKVARLLVTDEPTVAAAREFKKLQEHLFQVEGARKMRKMAHEEAMRQVIQERISAGLTGPMSEADQLEIAARAERLTPPYLSGVESDEVISQAKDILKKNEHLRTVADALDIVPKYERLCEEIEACRSSWDNDCSIHAPYQDEQHAQVDSALSKFNNAVSARAAACRKVRNNQIN